MPGPTPEFDTVTVRGKYVGFDGSAITGRVVFTPRATRLLDEDDLTVIIPRPIVGNLSSVSGTPSTSSFTVELPATDDPDITPVDFTYSVVEDFTGGESYDIEVPLSAAGTGLDIAELPHVYAIIPGLPGAIPDDSVHNRNVAADAAISLDKTADSLTRTAMTGVQVAKLASVADNATANSADAYLLDRSHHTGSQTIATISDAAAVLSLKADLVGGKVPNSQLPVLTTSGGVFVVASQAAMLALAAVKGDIAKRTDNGNTYVLSTNSPSTLADWLQINSGGAVTSVAGRTGAVVLAKADVGLGNVDNTSDANKPISTAEQNALDQKLNVGATLSAANLTGLAPIATATPGTLIVVDYVKAGGINGLANAWPASRPTSRTDVTVCASGGVVASPPPWLLDADWFDPEG